MDSEAPQSAGRNRPHRDEDAAIDANLKPSSWDYTHIQTLDNNYTEEAYGPIAEKLKEEVRCWLHGTHEPWPQLQLIYTVQRLGLSYHFEEEIKRALSDLYTSGYHCVVQKNGLHPTAVCFILLRQHGFTVSEEIFKDFMDENGSFMTYHSDDVKGLLSLYQASFLAFDGEITLEAARTFAMQRLKEMDTSRHGLEVANALDFPLHQTITRLGARQFIEAYESGEDVNPTLLLLAKIDFNLVQNLYQKEMQMVMSWWRRMDITKKMSSIRDKIMECYFGTIGIVFNPQLGYCREELTKVGMLILLIDDVYDIYGSMDELNLFTDAIRRWDYKLVEHLPEYMKACFYVVYNTTNEMKCHIQGRSEQDVLSNLKETWTDICESFLVEAKWHHNRYMPTLEEYLNNGWISSSGPLILIHLYLLLHKPPKETMQYQCDKLVCLSSMILRLYNDLATSMVEKERGDVPTSIECYMHETGVSETIAREYISSLISEIWKEMNKEYHSCYLFQQHFIHVPMNLARTMYCLYHHGDGFGAQNHAIKHYIKAILLEPLNLDGNGIFNSC